jgi:hypothetical protein
MNTFDVSAKYQGGYTVPRTSTEFITVHHAAAHYKQKTGIEDVEVVRAWHMEQHNGWPGIGYHLVLAEETEGGPIARYILSNLNLQRAHVYGQNHRAIGVSMLDDFTNTIPGEKWIAALVEACADLKQLFPHAVIVGHKEITLPGHGTTCPGNRWLDWKPRLLASVAAASIPPADPALPFGTFPVDAKFRAYWERSGGLWQPDRYCLGYAIAPRQGDIQKFERGALRLNPDGTISALLRQEW